MPIITKTQSRKFIRKIRERPYFFATIGVIFLAVTLNLSWINLDNNSPLWDTGRHVLTALYYWQLPQKEGFLQAFFGFWYQSYKYYPPFGYLVSAPFFTFLGWSLDTALASQNVFLIILGLASYGLGKEVARSRVGFLTSLVTITSPMLSSNLHDFQLDVPLTAMVVLSYYLLIKTNEFRNSRYSLLLGITSGLGWLTKWTFPTFLVPMAGLILLKRLVMLIRNRSSNSRAIQELQQLVGNLILVGLPVLIIAFPWYWENRLRLKRHFMPNAASSQGDPAGLNWDAIRWYFSWVRDKYLSFPLFISSLVGFLTYITKRTWRARYYYLLAMVPVGYFIFTSIPNKDTRYLFPIIPSMALFAVIWVEEIRTAAWRIVLASLIIGFALLNYWTANFGVEVLPPKLRLAGKLTVFEQRGYTSGPPQKDIWPMTELFSVVGKGNLRYSGSNLGRSGKRAMRYAVTYYNRQHPEKEVLLSTNIKGIATNNKQFYLWLNFRSTQENKDRLAKLKEKYPKLAFEKI